MITDGWTQRDVVLGFYMRVIIDPHEEAVVWTVALYICDGATDPAGHGRLLYQLDLHTVAILYY